MLDKAVGVLTAVEAAPRTLADLVTETGLSRATAHRVAQALIAHGLVRRDADGRYALGLRLVALGRAAADELTLAVAARPALAGLRDRTGESVQLYVSDGAHRICVASLESPHGLRTIVPLGAALDLSLGSAGHLLTEQPEALARGWSESIGEREAGVASVSAPILDAGRVVAAVSVSGPIERLTRNPGDRFADAVVDAARTIETAAALRP